MTKDKRLMTYDYIVIGAGSAGCVLANRLSANPNKTVLLLEAGKPDGNLAIQMPAGFSKLFKTESDWAYDTEPQSQLNQRRCFWPRGKVLGGSSSMNAMIYIRGHRWDYDHWQGLGNHGWGYFDLLPYFKAAQHQERGASEFHNIGGPLNVADLQCINPITRAFVAAATEAGLTAVEDLNSPEPEGVGFYQVTQKNGQRCSAATAYLLGIRDRPNLKIITGAQVTRLMWEGRRSVGVEYLWQGSTHQARVRWEVILSGGAVNSPQLLMLSGVGPGSHLQDLGIPVVADVPGVGENLQDHLVAGIVYSCSGGRTLDKAANLWNLGQYLLFQRGPLTSNVAEAGGFMKTREDLPLPDVQLYFAPAYFIDHGFTKPKGQGLTLGVVPLRPQSRGYIRLRSRDALVAPLIQPSYLTAPEDLDCMVAGLQFARRIMRGKALAPFRGEEVFPGRKYGDDLAAYVRDWAQTIYHPVGTCKMGSDGMAVVDSRLRVRGVAGVRVADASVMPTIVSGNTNAPTIAIGEKAADLILSEI
ncbi:GMC family oxidoreductase [[Phormidium] sp. ETS-05]|uniref:GMC family oxidoreductase n=1 Tax=[Phormidium] sp. ETS-05 TaxID=222819 RepID=UPI0018EF31E8|nr:GMC family oxidoreductase N-terminal domain-containing protein [[Phormidium] sp. ETS-05]